VVSGERDASPLAKQATFARVALVVPAGVASFDHYARVFDEHEERGAIDVDA
jgi:hypothetical protein